jgi:hypothetical protein
MEINRGQKNMKKIHSGIITEVLNKKQTDDLLQLVVEALKNHNKVKFDWILIQSKNIFQLDYNTIERRVKQNEKKKKQKQNRF